MSGMRDLHVEKVVVNIGVGEAGERLVKAEKVLEMVTGQKPVETISKTVNRDLGIRPPGYRQKGDLSQLLQHPNLRLRQRQGAAPAAAAAMAAISRAAAGFSHTSPPVCHVDVLCACRRSRRQPVIVYHFFTLSVNLQKIHA